MKRILDHLRKNWIQHAFETLVVTVGILGAFSLNSWNENRKDRALEKDYLERFLVDLKTDSVDLDLKRYLLNRKIKALDLIEEILNHNKSIDSDSLNSSIRRSAVLGWSIIARRSTATYSEIVSSGHLRLIRNSNLRQGVIYYYSLWGSESMRAEKRQSDYPDLIYKIFDRDNPTDSIDWFYKSIDRSDANIEFRRELRHESNYANWLRNQFMENTERAYWDLKEAITTELDKE